MNTASEPYRTALLITMSMLVEPVLQHRDGDGRIQAQDSQILQHVRSQGIRHDRQDCRGDHEQRGGREPLQLQPLLTRRRANLTTTATTLIHK